MADLNEVVRVLFCFCFVFWSLEKDFLEHIQYQTFLILPKETLLEKGTESKASMLGVKILNQYL